MTDEITEPTVHLCWNDFAIRGAVQALRAAHLGSMADDMEAHLWPPVDEPTEFGSMVRASSRMTDRVLWVRSVDYWFSETYRRAEFSELHRPEVLRVGIGETYPHASGDAVVLGPETVKSSDGAVINHKGENYYPRSDGDGSYNRGRRDTASAIHRDVSALRDSTPLVTERRAYDKILAVIAVLRGES